MENLTTSPPATLDPNADLRGRLDRLEALLLAVVDELVKNLAKAETTPRAARRATHRDGGGRIRPNWRN